MNNEQKPYEVKVTVSLIRQLVKNLRLLWALFTHPRVPLWVKGIPVVAFLYWLNPIDPLPPPLNLTPLDDAVAILLGMKLFVELCPPDLVAALRDAIEYGRPPDDDTVIDATYQILDDDS